jgi:hypothetical protein
MKNQSAILSVLCSLLSFTTFSTEHFDILLKSKWRNLDKNNHSIIDFGGKWVLVGSITFKKKSKEPLFIDTLNLTWNGTHIDHLVASLYKKNLSREFLPIEDNLVCDGAWNKTKQTLMFNFNEKETLNPTTIFYLVLTIPDHLETTLKNGTFLLEEHCLPKPFKQCSQTMHLSLEIHDASVQPTAIPLY